MIMKIRGLAASYIAIAWSATSASEIRELRNSPHDSRRFNRRTSETQVKPSSRVTARGRNFASFSHFHPRMGDTCRHVGARLYLRAVFTELRVNCSTWHVHSRHDLGCAFQLSREIIRFHHRVADLLVVLWRRFRWSANSEREEWSIWQNPPLWTGRSFRWLNSFVAFWTSDSFRRYTGV